MLSLKNLHYFEYLVNNLTTTLLVDIQQIIQR